MKLPLRLEHLIDLACQPLAQQPYYAEIQQLAQQLGEFSWNQFLAARTPDDNACEHEFIVLGNVLRIAAAERLALAELRVAVAFSFLHDSYYIPRITEWQIRAAMRAAEEESPGERRTQLQQVAQDLATAKSQQRQRHMAGGAEQAGRWLSALRPAPLSDDEIARCTHLIAHHDDWKLGRPWPTTDDRLALACVEGDALWPLHPLGILADLQRPAATGASREVVSVNGLEVRCTERPLNGLEVRCTGRPAAVAGAIRDVFSPPIWKSQLLESRQTLLDHRANWSPAEPGFIDSDSIFRTPAGWKIYRDWCRYHELDAT
ncbi:MAG: hypothetical protein ACKOBW_02905 [Planctomycetota bacterium]